MLRSLQKRYIGIRQPLTLLKLLTLVRTVLLSIRLNPLWWKFWVPYCPLPIHFWKSGTETGTENSIGISYALIAPMIVHYHYRRYMYLNILVFLEYSLIILFYYIPFKLPENINHFVLRWTVYAYLGLHVLFANQITKKKKKKKPVVRLL